MIINSWQIEDYIEVRSGRLHIDGVDAVAIAQAHGTPLFVFSESRIRHNIDRLKRVAEVIDRPLKLCYAAKAMSTMGILRVIRDAGIEIEVNSGGELWKALQAGFTGEQIIFNGTSKEEWEIVNAIEAGIYAIQVDSLYELSLIEDIARRLGLRANVSLRMVPEIESETHSGLQTALLTSKFGMMPDEAFEAFREYRDSPDLALNGIHLHVGSQNPDPSVYTEAFEKLFDGLVRINRETGLNLQHLNLGGGFPVSYLPGRADAASFPDGRGEMLAAEFDPADAIAQAWRAVRDTAANASASHLLDGLTILLEPGRSIIADAGVCLTTVRNAKTRPVTDSSPPYEGGVAASAPIAEADGVVLPTDHRPLTADNWLLTDAGFNNLLSMETYKWYYHLISAERADSPHDLPYKVAGPLCDGGDVYFDIEGEGRLPSHRLLPENVRPGEVLALLNTGAYTVAQESQYNGRFRPAILLIKQNGDGEVIRRRDNFDDLIASDL